MKHPTNSGIAIGPILFVVAILGVLGVMLSSGTGSMSSNTTVDRIKTELRGQANLIRAKMQECYMITMGNSGFGHPAGSNTDVSAVSCPGDPSGQQNLWRGARPASLPPTIPGFGEWKYYNYATGRCISIATSSSSPSQAVKDGLNTLAALFNTNEKHLNTTGAWVFSVWLTPMATPVQCGS
jgi:hypothetical protein